MSRPTLTELGMSLPPLVLTSPGALPAPPALLEARRAYARAVLSDAEIAEEAQHACEYWISLQERLGLDVLVDGQLDGRDLVCRFTDGLDGFTAGGMVRLYGNQYRRKPVISGPVSWREPISVDAWRIAQSMTSRPVKAHLTGPYTLMSWSFLDHYATRDAACLAIAGALRHEINALVTAGAHIVQVDEPALADPDADWALAAEALRLVTNGVGAYVIAHTCRDADPTPVAARPALPVDNVDITDADDPAPGMHATVGVFSAQSDEPATAETMATRVRAAVERHGSERLWVSADCGLAHGRPDLVAAQLAAMVQAVAEARSGLRATTTPLEVPGSGAPSESPDRFESPDPSESPGSSEPPDPSKPPDA